MSSPDCRRKNPRFSLVAPYDGTIQFGFPEAHSAVCTMTLLDLSRGGLSFVLAHELPGLEVGESIDAARVHLAGRIVTGDIVVMHLTPDAGRGAVCGALFFPTEDEDILALRGLISMLEAEAAFALTLSGV